MKKKILGFCFLFSFLASSYSAFGCNRYYIYCGNGGGQHESWCLTVANTNGACTQFGSHYGECLGVCYEYEDCAE